MITIPAMSRGQRAAYWSAIQLLIELVTRT
jgi:hypothetical protein